ncbi:MAG: sulfotransferase domain-containing protein [Pseudomonadota bacterium]
MTVPPDFVGIGAQKTGSTWLYKILSQHPEVAVSQEKEVDFFSYHYDRGYQWYAQQLPAPAKGIIRGEVSPSYWVNSDVPRRVKALAPQARILLCLRDPLERLLSNHRHEVRAGHMDDGDLTLESGLANNPMYLEQSRYAKHLKRWLAVFPREQIHVVFMEDIKSRPLEVAREVFRFVGVDEQFEPEQLTEQFNRSFAVRSRKLSGVKDLVYSAAQHPALSWSWKLATSLGLRSAYRRLNQKPSFEAIPAPTPATLEKLRGCLASDIDELSVLLERDLSHWLQR